MEKGDLKWVGIIAAVILIAAIFLYVQKLPPFGEDEALNQTQQYVVVNQGQLNQNTGAIDPNTIGIADIQNVYQDLKDSSAVPVENVSFSAKDAYTMAAVTDGDFKFYEPGADISDPYVQPVDTMDLTTGYSDNSTIQTNIAYNLVYESDGATYYDEVTTSFSVNYNPETGRGALMFAGKPYYAATAVGAFVNVDSIAEAQAGMDVTGNGWDNVTITAINTTRASATAIDFTNNTAMNAITAANCTVVQIMNISGGVIWYSQAVGNVAGAAGGNFTVSGCTATMVNNTINNSAVFIEYYFTEADTVRYDESTLSGSGRFRFDIGNANANADLQRVVMCFRDNDGDMEGNEVTAFTATYVSGSTAITIPGSLQTYWEDSMGGGQASCMTLASTIGSAEKARWEMTMTVNEANWDCEVPGSSGTVFVKGEEFEISFDDLGGYLQKQYPSRSNKATAETLRIGCQA